MKTCLAIFLTFVVSISWAAEAPEGKPQTDTVKGTVLEVINVSNFSYLRLQTNKGERWAAVLQAPVKQGESVTVENAILMHNFTSKALNRSFPAILFGNLAGVDTNSTVSSSFAESNRVMGLSSPLISKKMSPEADLNVAKASGSNAYTVAEIFSKANELKGKVVVVRGKVVKYNEAIMGKNWLHLRDGSGRSENDTNDLLVTSKAASKLGDIVTAKGVVQTDQDFGEGYSYKVLLDDASLQ